MVTNYYLCSLFYNEKKGKNKRNIPTPSISYAIEIAKFLHSRRRSGFPDSKSSQIDCNSFANHSYVELASILFKTSFASFWHSLQSGAPSTRSINVEKKSSTFNITMIFKNWLFLVIIIYFVLLMIVDVCFTNLSAVDFFFFDFSVLPHTATHREMIYF